MNGPNLPLITLKLQQYDFPKVDIAQQSCLCSASTAAMPTTRALATHAQMAALPIF
ncbi:MAG: hypothetical protein ACJAYH_001581 [Celeribacter sp.]|jgi:hypothetical protein